MKEMMISPDIEARLQQLVEELDAETVTIVAKAFLEHAQRTLGLLENLSENGSLAEIANVIHAIKGSVRNVGDTDFGNELDKIEAYCRSGSCDCFLGEKERVVGRLEATVKQVERWIEKECEEV